MSAVAIDRPRVHVRATAQASTEASAPIATGRRSLVLALSTALVVIAAVFGIVAFKAMAADAAVEARALELVVAQSELRYAELIAEVATKEDPSRIRALALELGLVPSSAARHLILSRGIDADGSRRALDVGPLVADPLKSVLTQGR
jgi:cell division protein FtsL